MTDERKGKHIDVMASATWEAKRKAGLDDNGDDIGPWFLPVAGWEDLPEHEQEAHYLRQYEIDDATAAAAALVEAGFVVMPREPTEAMRFAGTEQFRPQAVQYSVSDGLRWQNCMTTAPIHIYRAMVEAAEK
jgi:hypothetical protein